MENYEIKVRCDDCGKVLFEGTERGAKDLIVYCVSCGEKGDKSPGMLQTIKMDNGEIYFVDERLKQLRNVNNPHDYIDF